MARYPILVIAGLFSCVCSIWSPAQADVIIITQAKAVAGNVTPGDADGFPVTLTQPGSYRLATGLTPGKDKDGIVVAAPDVTIDLDGFRLAGGPAGGTDNSLVGIRDLGDRLTVKNGTIASFETAGIRAQNRLYLVVENMRIIYGGGRGIDNEGGSFTLIQNSIVSSNGYTGIYCGQSCQVEGSVISRNGGNGGGPGIVIATGTVLGNTLMENKDVAVYGPGPANRAVGIGNNTMLNNNPGGAQIVGNIYALFPNLCQPTAC